MLKICQTVVGISITIQFDEFFESRFWRVFDVWPNCLPAARTHQCAAPHYEKKATFFSFAGKVCSQTTKQETNFTAKAFNQVVFGKTDPFRHVCNLIIKPVPVFYLYLSTLDLVRSSEIHLGNQNTNNLNSIISYQNPQHSGCLLEAETQKQACFQSVICEQNL